MVSGLYALAGILVALHARHAHRPRPARRRLDARRADLAAHAITPAATSRPARVPTRRGNQHPSIAPYETYRAERRLRQHRRRQRRAVARAVPGGRRAAGRARRRPALRHQRRARRAPRGAARRSSSRSSPRAPSTPGSRCATAPASRAARSSTSPRRWPIRRCRRAAWSCRSQHPTAGDDPRHRRAGQALGDARLGAHAAAAARRAHARRPGRSARPGRRAAGSVAGGGRLGRAEVGVVRSPARR